MFITFFGSSVGVNLAEHIDESCDKSGIITFIVHNGIIFGDQLTKSVGKALFWNILSDLIDCLNLVTLYERL